MAQRGRDSIVTCFKLQNPREILSEPASRINSRRAMEGAWRIVVKHRCSGGSTPIIHIFDVKY